MNNTTWLESLEIGSEVILTTRHGEIVTTVSRFTKTQIVLNKTHHKFNRSTGYKVGDIDWIYWANIREATPSAHKRVKYNMAKKALLHSIEKDHPIKDLNNDQLQRIFNITQEK
jgi:hypothetical protein